jgi:cell wall-associated NlpC family hydrolase
MQSDIRERIVAEAMTWRGTPYRHQGSVKGVGADCVWSLIRIYQAVGLVPLDFTPGNYSREWYFHKAEEIYLGGVEKFAKPTDAPGLGDVALYKYGKCISHGAVIVGEGLIVHANRRVGKVELCEMRTHADKFHSYWTAIP